MGEERKSFKEQGILIYRSMEFTFINRNPLYRHYNRYFLIRFLSQYTVKAESTSFVTCSSSPLRGSTTRNNACGRTDHRHLTFKWRQPKTPSQTRRVLIVSSYDRKETCENFIPFPPLKLNRKRWLWIEDLKGWQKRGLQNNLPQNGVHSSCD